MLFLFLTFSLAASAGSVSLEDVAHGKPWLRLLHYQKTFWGGYKSQLDGQDFFFAADGKINPMAELKASIQAMSEIRKVGKLGQQPHCAFPERYRYLRENFNVPSRSEPCEKLDEFMGGFNGPKALSVVFSSAFPNSPASMFGHSFLKVHSSQNTDLLDVGVNFAANVSPKENGLSYMWLGTTGGYDGAWSLLPYYAKVNDYSNFESRDLWEYELNLSPEEIQRFLHHLWEMETNSTFDYYFFDENCSYQIVAAIEAIKPEWHITQHTIYVIPGETFKNLAATPGIIRNVVFRPSFHKRMLQRYNALTKEEKSEFFALIENRKDVHQVKSRFVLDSVATYYDYARNEQKGKYKERFEALRQTLLIHRATLGPPSQEEINRVPQLVGTTRPDWGHDSYTLFLNRGWREMTAKNNAEFTSLRIRSAYHDLLNNDLGYRSHSQMNFFDVELQHDTANRQWRLEQFTLLNIASLHALSALDKRWSYKFSTGLDTPRDYGCLTCRHLYFAAAGGATLDLFSERYVVYALGQGRAEFYRGLENGYRAGPGLNLGTLLNPWSRYKLKFEWTGQWFVNENLKDRVSTLSIEQSVSLTRNLELRNGNSWQSSSKIDQDLREFKLELLYFFN